METDRVDSDVQIGTVTLPIAPFRETNPKSWFGQLESQFSLRGIRSEKTKFHLVVSALPLNVIDDIDDILDLPDDRKTYDAVKTAVLRRTGLSDRQRVTKLLNETDLGDLKPSQLLRKMQSLAKPTSIDDSFLREMWLQRLPREMLHILCASEDAPLSKLADTADRIWESYGQVSQVQTKPDNDIATLKSQMATLTRQFADFSASRHNRCKCSRSRSRSRSKSPSRSPNRNGYCWYHERFGQQAKSCRPPCSFKRQQQGNGRTST
ncbi:unnamed protein product [Dicrocoelium dendriticum]|nr:unnamed protein product [Dicrocoelium dendriticum]